MTVGISTGGGAAALSESELAEYEQEKPARRLRPALDQGISGWCAVISVGVLLQVFFPLSAGTQFYLVIFLAAVLPITLLCYRGWRVPAFLNPLKARSTDDPGIADWILAAVALAVCVYPLPESVDAMKSGSIDALVWSGGIPTGGITDLMTSLGKDVKLIPITDLLQPLQTKYGTIYAQGNIAAAAYKQPADVATIIVSNVLLVRKNMPDELAEKLTKVIFDNKDSLVQVNAAAKDITLDNAAKTDPVPLHPGSQKALDTLK